MPLRELVTILDASELVISLDTAPLHMSVALERPVISLMGYNNPKRVGPYRRFHDLIVDAYGEPGEDYPISYAHRLGRMKRITVRDVLDKVERWQAALSRAVGEHALVDIERAIHRVVDREQRRAANAVCSHAAGELAYR